MATATPTTSRSTGSAIAPPTWPARRSDSRSATTEICSPAGWPRSPTPQSDFDPNGPADDGNPFGTPEAELHVAADVAAYIPLKRKALAAHASQVTDIGMFLAMPDEHFAMWAGTEWYIEPGAPPGLRPGWLLP